MKRIFLAALALVMPLSLTVATPPPAQAAEYTKVVRYGPFTIPGGTATDPGMIHNALRFAVARPCTDC